MARKLIKRRGVKANPKAKVGKIRKDVAGVSLDLVALSRELERLVGRDSPVEARRMIDSLHEAEIALETAYSELRKVTKYFIKIGM